MKYLLTISLISLLLACNLQDSVTYSTSIDIEVHNNTTATIDSIGVYCNGYRNNIGYFTLNPGQSSTYTIDMNNVAMGDGDYVIEYQYGTPRTKQIKRFGYYTNGSPLEELIEVEISADTIICKYH